MKKNTFKIKKNSLIDFSLLVLITSLCALRVIPVFMYIAQLLFIIIIALKIKEDGLYINLYIIFYGIFALWSITSIFWSAKPQSTIKSIIPLVQIVILCALMVQYYIKDSIIKVDKVLYYFCISSAILVVLILLKTSVKDWLDIMKETNNAATSQGRLGRSVGFHPNSLGIVLSFSSLIWLYFISKNKTKVSIFMYLILAILVVFTKSRKALIVLILGSAIYFILYKKRNVKKILFTTPIIILIAFGVYWCILNIPFLYKMVGFRMEGLFAIFDSSYSADASVLTRANMVDVAIELFKQNPITGVGLGNYSYHYFYEFGGWAETYAHNNYFEILSGLGIIGFILYYFIPFKMLCTIFLKRKQFLNYDRKLFAFILTFIILRLFMDYGMVTYNDEFIQLLTSTLYCGICSLNFITKGSSNNNIIKNHNK